MTRSICKKLRLMKREEVTIIKSFPLFWFQINKDQVERNTVVLFQVGAGGEKERREKSARSSLQETTCLLVLGACPLRGRSRRARSCLGGGREMIGRWLEPTQRLLREWNLIVLTIMIWHWCGCGFNNGSFTTLHWICNPSAMTGERSRKTNQLEDWVCSILPT